jgi:MFS family permease
MPRETYWQGSKDSAGQRAGQTEMIQRYPALKGRALTFLFFAWFLWFMNFTIRAILSPVLPLLEDEFAVGHARASSLFIFFSLGNTLSVFSSGFLANLVGSKKTIFMSLALGALAYFFMPLVQTFECLYPITFVSGIAVGMYIPAMIPLLTDYYDKNDWGKVIAIHDSGAPISIFVTPFLALAVLSFVPWRWIFLLIAATLTVCAVVFFMVAEERRLGGKNQRFFNSRLWGRPELWYMGVSGTLLVGASLGIYFVTPLYLIKELSMAPGEANALLGGSRIGGAAVGIFTGFFVDRFSLKKTMFFLAIISGILTMLLAVRDVTWIKVLFFVQATVVMGFFPISFVAVSRLFEAEDRSQATSIIVTFGATIGSGLIPYLLGLSGDLISFRFGIFVLGVLATLSSGLLLYLKELN